jgi:hypothetical protein
MAIQCIDIADNKKLGSPSIVAIGAWVACFVTLTALMKTSFLYFICLAVSYLITQIFFQYTPRIVILSIIFLTKNHYLTPSFEDSEYIGDETQFKNIQRILPKPKSREK